MAAASNPQNGAATDTTATTSSATHKEEQQPPPPAPVVVACRITRAGPRCPFGNAQIEFSVAAGGCVWLRGASGRGKTTAAMHLAGLLPAATLARLDVAATVAWNEEIPVAERCGVLFQQTTLLDELTVAGNLALALQQHDRDVVVPNSQSEQQQQEQQQSQQQTIKRLLDAVGLRYERDAGKRVTELSGGMGRRASLALQLAQRKRCIVLDEPFAGLDHEAARAVAKELVRLRTNTGAGAPPALILIAHEWDLARAVLAEDRPACRGRNAIVEFDEPPHPRDFDDDDDGDGDSTHNWRKRKQKQQQPNLFGISFFDRFLERLVDYIGYSLPLILLTFTACGMAIAMLSSDTLRRVDVSRQVLTIVDREVRPLIKMLTGEDASPLHMMGVNLKVKAMLNESVPPAKATLYATGMARLFVLEIGPLLTALLLTGRIGGSYAGRVATLRATSQSQLLRTLGVSPVRWSLFPALLAALWAGPVLTVSGTALAVWIGGWCGGGLGAADEYWEQVRATLWPELRLTGRWVAHGRRIMLRMAALSSSLPDDDGDEDGRAQHRASNMRNEGDGDDWLLRSTFSPALRDTVIEIVTYPPVYHLVKAVAFTLIIMGTAEVCARHRHAVLTPRHVPSVITTAVVTAGLLVILADWLFSRLWLQRR